MPALFISYRREDSAGYAGRLHEELEQRLAGWQVFRDVDTLRPGQDFDNAIRERLSQCAACVVLIGPGWLKSQTGAGQRRLEQPGDYVAMEIAAALARDGVLVVPVLVGGATMPPADELPETIRILSRRHAFSARDETWEADMDRLATILAQDAGGSLQRHSEPAIAGGHSPRFVWGVLGVLAVIAVLLIVGWMSFGNAPAGSPSPSGTPGSPAVADDQSAVASPAFGIDIPASGAEIAHGELTYTPLSGSVQVRGNSTRVWLRLRVSNAGFTDANVWDDSFRLVTGGVVTTASGGLNEILEKRSIRQVVVRFDVPSRPASGALRITNQGQSGDIPLDLTSNGRPAAHDQQDEGDSLSRATITSIVRDAQPLVDADAVDVTLVRIANRHFVNTQKIVVGLQWTNRGRYAMATGDVVLRLTVAGETLAPSKQPSETVEGGTNFAGDVIFDVKPAARQGVLTVSFRGKTRDLPITFK